MTAPVTQLTATIRREIRANDNTPSMIDASEASAIIAQARRLNMSAASIERAVAAAMRGPSPRLDADDAALLRGEAISTGPLRAMPIGGAIANFQCTFSNASPDRTARAAALVITTAQGALVSFSEFQNITSAEQLGRIFDTALLNAYGVSLHDTRLSFAQRSRVLERLLGNAGIAAARAAFVAIDTQGATRPALTIPTPAVD